MSGFQSREKRIHRGIENASRRRQTLLEDGRLSLPSRAGKLAIIVSRARSTGSSSLTPREQHQAFLTEAQAIKQRRLPLHQEVVIRPIAVFGDMKLDFADPEVTDIILIGHGSINAIWAEGSNQFDWEAASKATAYLKQGRIEQRMCGNLPSGGLRSGGGHSSKELPHKYSVPLGTFAVSKLTNVVAAAGIVVPDINPSDQLFTPVFTSDIDPIAEIAEFNERFGNAPSVPA